MFCQGSETSTTCPAWPGKVLSKVGVEPRAPTLEKARSTHPSTGPYHAQEGGSGQLRPGVSNCKLVPLVGP